MSINECKAIPVAFICDDNYALPTAVAITSEADKT